MSVEFFNAKNGSNTAKAGGVHLHSSYNPECEAERFVQDIEIGFDPSSIVVVEGALSYSARHLKKKFPNAKTATIRLCRDFGFCDSEWDEVFYSCAAEEAGNPNGADKNAKALSEQLYDALGEEGVFSTFFLDWPAAAKAFKDEAARAWNEIRTCVEKAKAVLVTREYFAKRWLKNKINFFCRIKSSSTLPRASLPVFLCASGPSLAAAIPLIKRARGEFFLVALSSAISPLLSGGIVPDLCFSTDGGYWAKKHLDALVRHIKSGGEAIALALSFEGACHSEIFDPRTTDGKNRNGAGADEKTMIIPLCYSDDVLSKKIAASLGIGFMEARRNGTVSGTALEFFLGNSTGDVFFAGLDLQTGTLSQHSAPNAIETDAQKNDTRLRTMMTRQVRASTDSNSAKSLGIYAAWFRNFKNKNPSKKIYRICPDGARLADLGGAVLDIGADEVLAILGERDKARPASAKTALSKEKKTRSMEKGAAYAAAIADKEKRAALIKSAVREAAATDWWKRELFAAESILERRASDDEERTKHREKILEKSEKLIEEIFRKL